MTLCILIRMKLSAAERTRRAILVAAIHVLGANRSASTREIAEAAQVSRSTIHRYFPDRPTLVAALGEFVDDEYNRVVDSLRPDDGTAQEVLIRLASELFDGMEIFGWWFFAWDLVASDDADMDDELVDSLVQRGHAEGSVDRLVNSKWLNMVLWSMLFAAHSQYIQGSATQGELRTQLIHGVRKLLSP